MANYSYNVVSTDRRTGGRPVTWHREPRGFPGTADEFAQAMLGDALAGEPRLAGEFVVVNVWDSDRQGIGVPAQIIGRAINNPEEPQRPDEIDMDYGYYYVASTEYDDLDEDAVLGRDGSQWSHGVRAGLVVPAEGPVLLIRTGHQFGYVTLETSRHDREPELDLAAWEAAEQVTVRPEGPVLFFSWDWQPYDRYPDLADGRDTEYLTIRISARGRDANFSLRGRPADRPGEHHRVQAWPAPGPAARQVLKRDQASWYWENAGTVDPP